MGIMFLPSANVLNTIAQANPAAGAEFTITVPDGKIWQPLCLKPYFVAAVAVANRNIAILFNNVGTNTIFFSGDTTDNIVAGETWRMIGCVLGADRASLTGAIFNKTIYFNIPPLFLLPGATIKSLTSGIQAADQWVILNQGVCILEYQQS